MAFYPQDWAGVMQPAIYSWVSEALGAPWAAVWSDQDAPAPPKPFARMKATGLPQTVGVPFREPVDVSPSQMDQRIRARGDFVLEVQLYADTEELEALERVRFDLERWERRESLRAAGLVAGEPLTASDISEYFAGGRELRYLLEVPMQVEIRQEFSDDPWIETVLPTEVEVS